MVWMDAGEIGVRVGEWRLALHWLGFILPCLIATAYLVWRRDGLTAWHMLLWVVSTVATYFFSMRILRHGVGIYPLYSFVAFCAYLVPGLVRWKAPPLAAGTIASLTFFSMAAVDLVAVLLHTPQGEYPTLGGGGLHDMLVRSPLQVAIWWACWQIVLQTRVQRPRRLIHPPAKALLGFNFSLRPPAALAAVPA